MNSLFSQISLFSSSILLKSARSIVGSSSIYGICSNLSSKSSLIKYPVSIKSSSLRSSALSRFGVTQCCYYSTKKVSTRKRKSTAKTVMEDEKDAFFVVRKGDIVGVYKSLSDCQAQVGSSICDPPVSVYKGYSLPGEAEEHLISRGLQNALYTIKASDFNDELFGSLVPCPFQEPAVSTGETSSMDIPEKRPLNAIGSGNLDIDCVPSNKLPKLDYVSCDSQTCVLEFDGASKGNPGPAGAGAVLRTLNGSVICKIRQGLGTATNNVAEYQAVILGLKRALEMGYTSIQAKGDSKLVCMQLQGLWKVKNQNMADLHAEATKLKKKFTSFKISHVLRGLNSDADAQANLGVTLANGQIQESVD
ncbi:uncharacterized protein LOC141598648 [Silene latifolia]|uniref:uncharacterized protein LOC141598648 n=1 Tax=Silene latifolia TaxID=37657 RepID=UPI003D76B14D